MNFYLRMRKWVDLDLATRRHPVSIFGPLFIVIFAMAGARLAGPVAEGLGWMVIVPPGAGWAAFVAWRATRLLRAASINGDRDFDQRGKFLLALEYQRSESVTSASQRKRSQRRRSQQ